MVKLFGKLSMKYGVMRSLLGRLGGAILVATASAFLRDRRRSPWAFPRGWTNPRRIRSKFVVATKAVSSPSVKGVKKFKTGGDREGEAPAEPHGPGPMGRQGARPPNFF